MLCVTFVTRYPKGSDSFTYPPVSRSQTDLAFFGTLKIEVDSHAQATEVGRPHSPSCAPPSSGKAPHPVVYSGHGFRLLTYPAAPDRGAQKPPTIEQGIRAEVHRPHLVRGQRCRLPIPPSCTDMPTRPFVPQTQAVFPVKPLDPFVVHDPAFMAKQDVDPEVAVSHLCLLQCVGDLLVGISILLHGMHLQHEGHITGKLSFKPEEEIGGSQATHTLCFAPTGTPTQGSRRPPTGRARRSRSSRRRSRSAPARPCPRGWHPSSTN